MEERPAGLHLRSTGGNVMGFWSGMLRAIGVYSAFDWPDTVGPLEDGQVATTPYGFVEGWWSGARRTPAHPGRLGSIIRPSTVVLHTTDMAPGTFNALVKAWTTRRGRGNAAHFLIGKTEADGVVQFAPVFVNANHAGGGGMFRRGPAGALVHPNSVAVGVELDNAGKLRYDKEKGAWVHPDTGARVDNQHVERGVWEAVTKYQFQTLASLLHDMEPLLASGEMRPVPNGDHVSHRVPWGAMDLPASRPLRVVGHVTLNPVNKTDPGPQVMRWVKAL